MNESNIVETSKLSRRGLIRAAATLAGGAAVGTISPAAPAQTHDAEGARFTGDKVHSSISKNVAETDSGKVSGYDSGGIIIFKGIPYGGDTNGANRFMPAQKPKPWTGTRSSLHWGPVSPQTLTSTWGGKRNWGHDDEAFLFQWDDGQPSEDCLRVNVWTPALDNKKRPVLFWIHGGGFTTGSSNEMNAYDGENLARRGDVVVVSLNHRLGAIGFMNLSAYGSQYAESMNVGVTDVAFALKWVQTNIFNFGGDPNTVMIFGQSGGGGKTSTLMGMPGARGLFHRAVIQSSGGPIRQGTMDISAALTDRTLKQLGISKANIEKIHQVSVEDIIEAGRLAQRGDGALGQAGGWSPVVDGRILPRNVWDPAAPEASASVPLMIGNVLNEMGNSVQMGDASLEDLSEAEVRQRLDRNFPGRGAAVYESICSEHTIRQPFDVLAISAGLPRRKDVVKIANLRASAHGHAPAYVYKFVWQTPVLDGRPRSFHCSELPFVFFNTDRSSNMTGGGPVPMALSEKMADAWVSFARKGDPNHSGLPKWSPASTNGIGTMVFDNKCELKMALDADELRSAYGA